MSFWLDWALQESLARGRESARTGGDRLQELARELAAIEESARGLRERLQAVQAVLDEGGEGWHH